MKELALACLAVAVLVGTYTGATALYRANNEGQARATFQRHFGKKDGLEFGRFSDAEIGEQCVEFTLLAPHGDTLKYGAARIIKGDVAAIYPSFEECRIRAAG